MFSVTGPVQRVFCGCGDGSARELSDWHKAAKGPGDPKLGPLREGGEEARKGRFLESPAQASSSAWPFLQAIVVLGGPSQPALQGGISGRHRAGSLAGRGPLREEVLAEEWHVALGYAKCPAGHGEGTVPPRWDQKQTLKD